jgi:hypothetical protein
MDPNTAQKAFSTDPPVNGAFSWSPSRDTMTFTPQGTGFHGDIEVRARVAATAASADRSRTLFAPYELKFRTH